MAEKALLVDVSKCIGCKACQVACKQWHDLQQEPSHLGPGGYQNQGEITARNWVVVNFMERGASGDVRWSFRPHLCMQCTEAPCVDVCPTGALYRHATGVVDLKEGWCIGEGYCVQACPYGAIRLDPDKGIAQKCFLCIDRITSGEQPACAKACPPGAIQFGDREAMVAQAEKRVAVLRSTGQPEARAYGGTQLGGLHVLSILLGPPEVYALPEDPPRATAGLAANWASGLLATAAAIAIPIWWVIHRRGAYPTGDQEGREG